MALFFECVLSVLEKCSTRADIVREACSQQLGKKGPKEKPPETERQFCDD